MLFLSLGKMILPNMSFFVLQKDFDTVSDFSVKPVMSAMLIA